MKYSITHLVLLAGAVAGVAISPVCAGTRKSPNSPVVITPPAVPNGSNMSRAPFPAARPQNDVTPPNGEAFDQNMAPNTPSTTPEPEAPPPARVAILQPRGEQRVDITTEPGSMPTGRVTTSAAASLEATRLEPTIRSATFETRDTIVSDIRTRVKQSDATVSQFRRTENQMSTEGRAQFQSAADDVKAREKALMKSLKAAERASNAEWDAARAQLVSDYDAYAASVARLDAAVGAR